MRIYSRYKSNISEKERRKAIKNWSKGPLTNKQIKKFIKVLSDENFHHRIPQSKGGESFLGHLELVHVYHHVLWHQVFEAHNARVTAGIAQDLLEYEGWGEMFALIDKKTGLAVHTLRGQVEITPKRFESFKRFRYENTNGELSSLLRMINTSWNDPRYLWVS